MSHNNLTILIVDNRYDDTTMLDDILSNDYNLVHADNDKNVMDTALRYTPSLILVNFQSSDIKESSGICNKLKSCSLTQNIPVISIVSSNHALNDKINLELGVVDCITKPFSASELHSQIKVNLLLRTAFSHFR
jgi:response regulator RpfG family c-di-GMP phosphodiesterase